MSETATIPGIMEWPTRERFDEARRAVTDAFNAFERLQRDYRALNSNYDAVETAHESAPVTTATIAAVVEFLVEIEGSVIDLDRMHKEISEWPNVLAATRLEQGVTA